MKDLLVLHTVEEVRILAEPLRVQIREALTGDPLTVKQVADRFGEKPTKLYHHFELMEKAGLIQKVKTQKKRGTFENYYQATAKSFTLDLNLFSPSTPSHESIDVFMSLFNSLFESTLVALRSSLRAGLIVPEDPQRTGTLAGYHIEATPEQLAAIHRKLQDLLTAAHKREGKGGTLAYNLSVAFFPVEKRATKPPRAATKRSRR